MKKILKFICIALLVTVLVGCGCSKKDNNGKNSIDETKEVEKLFNTDDSKLVYDNNGLFTIVAYHKDGKITGLEHYYKFNDAKTAEEEAKKLREEFKYNTQIEKVENKGIYVIYVMSEDQYKDKTVQELKDSYSYLVPVYK